MIDFSPLISHLSPIPKVFLSTINCQTLPKTLIRKNADFILSAENLKLEIEKRVYFTSANRYLPRFRDIFFKDLIFLPAIINIFIKA